MSEYVTTPVAVENRLRQLSAEVDEAHKDVAAAEAEYHDAKAAHEIAFAEAYLRTVMEGEPKLTVDDRKQKAILAVKDERFRLATAEALVRAARANVDRLRTQADLTRSVGTLVREAMTLT